MSLDIELISSNQLTTPLLIGENNSKAGYSLLSIFDKADLHNIRYLQPVNSIVQSFSKENSTDFKIISSYIYLHPYSFSSKLVRQYLNDCGFLDIDPDLYFELMKQARIEKLESDFDFKELGSIIVEKSSNLIRISDVLPLMKNLKTVTWIFDELNEKDELRHTSFNLMHVVETMFKIEDERQLIFGLSLTFLELLHGIEYYVSPEALKILCSLVPIEMRDKYSVGRLLTHHENSFNYLHHSIFKKCEVHGIDSSGFIKRCNGTYRFHSSEILPFQDNPELLPLFLKLTK